MKRIFPLLWLGFLGLFFCSAFFASQKSGKALPLAMFVVPGVMLGFTWWLMRRLVFDLADEVYDEGDALRVRKGAIEERVALENIMNISYAGLTNPPRCTLTLRQGGALGREISFSPVQRLFGPLLRTSNPIITDLIERVDAARRR